MNRLSRRLEDLGISLPSMPAPLAAYIPARISGDWCYTSGQLPFLNGRIMSEGPVGPGVSLVPAREACRQAALNALAAAATAAGHVDRIRGVFKVTGFVQSLAGFCDQAQVLNGASDLFLELFADEGRHVRSAIGCSALPLNATVEVECVFVLHTRA